jgi:hypothetical protein
MNAVPSETVEPAATPQPKLITNFDGYSPSFDVTSIASRMIASIPANLLFGLDAVVFTNMHSLSQKRRTSTTKSRGRKVKIGNTAGLYHGKWQGKPAWIEIFVDKAMYDSGRYRWVFRMPFIRDIFLSSILFHEIGHHIHATAQPEYREKEDVADKWKLKLQKHYMRSRYPMLTTVLRLMRPLIGVIEPLIKPSDEVIRSIEGRRR